MRQRPTDMQLGNQIVIGFDMFGCPNHCRHCFVGDWPNTGILEREVRRIAALFRELTRDGRSRFDKVWVSTSIREPDFSDDYRRLYELEAELSDGKPWRFELLSIWRLARDETYAPWAKSVGPDTCQITLFGEEEVTDWFCRRRGAFSDALAATERLLDAGMKPRWQLFANTRGIGDFGRLLERVESMRLRERVAALGCEFDIFMHPWGADAEALAIEDLRPTEADMRRVPAELVESSRRHFRHEPLWQTEAELYQQIIEQGVPMPYALSPGHLPWFLIVPSLDVYFNACGMEPWWRLGNVRDEPLHAIIDRLERHDTPGLRTVYRVDPQELARRYGRFDGQRVYSCVDDLLRLYVAKHCGRHSEESG